MSFESSVQTSIMTYLQSIGAQVDNIQGNEMQSSVPDLLVCYKGRYMGFEVKGPTGTLRPGQRKRLIRIQKAGGIGEVVHGTQKVKQIIETIDRGEVWPNSDYRRKGVPSGVFTDSLLPELPPAV